MNSKKELILLAKEIRNKNAREWRRKNKDKVKAINQRYWLKKAEKELKLREEGEK